jgi:hypothetical protein
MRMEGKVIGFSDSNEEATPAQEQPLDPSPD